MFLILKLTKKYEEEFNDEENEDDIDENLTIDEIENKLDSKVPDYNRFNKDHPMKGIFYTSKNTWRFNLGKYE